MIYTFYSYKGGVGRSMALANVAELLYRSGRKVLVVDWDLEAPGLERFFPIDVESALSQTGVIDMLLAYKKQMEQGLIIPEGKDGLPLDKPEQFAIEVYADAGEQRDKNKERLWLLTAGRRSKEYFAKYANAVLTFDWEDFYKNWEGELYFEWLGQQFNQMADVVLIDSRTGLTEMGGVCTYQLADVVLMFCAANKQSLAGTHWMAQNLKGPEVKRLRRGRPLHVLIIPARVERNSELADTFKKEFIDLFRELAPRDRGISVHQLWDLGIPYVPMYAFSEVVAVRESYPKGEEPDSVREMVKVFQGLGEVMKKIVLGIGIEVPKGAVPLDSPFYIKREADKKLEEQLERSGTIITIRGARQTGKTSLLIREMDNAKRRGAMAVHIDFQGTFGQEELKSPDSFLKALANLIASRLDLDFSRVESIWQSPLPPMPKITQFVEKLVLQKTTEPTVLAFDEADTLLSTQFYGEFFGMLRTWHNERASSELWKRLNIIIAISTNPTLLISNVHQSPFNVGTTIMLQDFSQDQILDLNQRHRNPMTREEVTEAMELFGGHPYLIRQAFYTLVSEDLSWAKLTQIAHQPDGPYGDHLNMYWDILERDPELMCAIQGIVSSHTCPDEKTLLRLESAGLVEHQGRKCICRYGLYERFFRSQLL